MAPRDGDATREDGASRPRSSASRIEISGEEFVVLEWTPSPAVLASLSTAETGVARLLLAGASNAEIAGARGRSLGTVAKQVTRVFRKLGVHSRSELFARVGAAGAKP